MRCPSPRFVYVWPRQRARRIALAVLLGWSLLPAIVTREVRPCAEVPEAVTADVSRDGGTSAGLPDVLPPEWTRAPCPDWPNVRTVRRACFLTTGQRPPCSTGYEAAGECLVPMTGAKRPGTSVQR
jgi:hypothetical protein